MKLISIPVFLQFFALHPCVAQFGRTKGIFNKQVKQHFDGAAFGGSGLSLNNFSGGFSGRGISGKGLSGNGFSGRGKGNAVFSRRPAPTKEPTRPPTRPPTPQPTQTPSSSPSASPSFSPSASPSDAPSTSPSDAPSDAPSESPSDAPSTSPSDAPSDTPSTSPSDAPSDTPSTSPSDAPSESPSDAPSTRPSDAPSNGPSESPSDVPSDAPSESPSDVPSTSPSDAPSKSPTISPTKSPTKSPTTSPITADCNPSSTSNEVCTKSTPICSDITFPANAGTQIRPDDQGNDFGCLNSVKNPAWFYFKISTAGPLNFTMSAGSDIDFILYGPFSSYDLATGKCGGFTETDKVGCSYSGSSVETAGIANAQAGDIYILLMSNFANTFQNVTITQSTAPNQAVTDCSISCF